MKKVQNLIGRGHYHFIHLRYRIKYITGEDSVNKIELKYLQIAANKKLNRFLDSELHWLFFERYLGQVRIFRENGNKLKWLSLGSCTVIENGIPEGV